MFGHEYALGLIALGMLNSVPHKGMPIQSLRMDPCLNRVFIIKLIGGPLDWGGPSPNDFHLIWTEIQRKEGVS